MSHIVIVGGGIAGLAAAYRLRQQEPQVAITLLEQSGVLGGKIQTERLGDFVIEAGPDSFLSRKPRGVGLAQELGLEARLQGRNPQFSEAFIKRHGELYPLPEGITGMVPTNLEALERSELLSAEGRARWAAEPTVPPRTDDGDESIAAFVTRRMGAELFQEVVEPLMVGIYAGDASRLSIQATFPNLRQLEKTHGSLLVGLAQSNSPAAAPTLPPFVTLPSGMAELVESLVAALTPSVTFRLNTAVSAIAHADATDAYTLTLSDNSTLTADALIIATPAFVTADLLDAMDSELAALHRDIPYASSVIVTLAFANDESASLNGRGYIVPSVEQSDILAATASSNKWHGRAPQGATLFRVFLGRSGRQDVTALSDDTLRQMARDELRDTLGISAEPILTRVQRWHQGMPQYTLGHLDRLAAIDARLAHHPRLALAGAAYRGVGIPDCIASGEAAATQILAALPVAVP